ncbi:thioredoxin domain-containing protein [Candidatus Uhrbacteria bacterium]|nr:thioredoxin domain-containing protein [Candidatus Uhrbacteria bacterium]
MSNDERVSESCVTVSSRASFVIGLVSGVMFLCTIGFFILLGIVLNGQPSEAASTGTVPVAAEDAGTVPSAPVADTIGPVDPVTSADRVWGSDSAKVDLIVYSDIECPYCGRFHDTLRQVQDQYEDRVRIVFRHFPLSFHPNAMSAALASECAGDQGRFWEFLDAVFAVQGDGLGNDLYESTAGKLGLNLVRFRECVADADFTEKVNADRAGGTSAGISGTPGSVIVAADGSLQEIPGALPFESVKPMLDAALAR